MTSKQGDSEKDCSVFLKKLVSRVRDIISHTRKDNLLKSKLSYTFLILLVILLSITSILSCTASVTASIPTTTNTTIPTEKSIPSSTISSTPEPVLTPTPDTWEIQKCLKTPNVLEIESGFIWQYIGDIERRGKIEMLLNFTADNQILGFAFEFQSVKEYQVSGCLEERIFTLWLQQENSIVSVIRGEFPTKDPRGNYSSSSELSSDVMKGSLMQKDNFENFPVYLRLSSGTYGNMEHRFQLAGTEDDDLILNASRQFINAVAKNDRTQVVDMLRFPVEIWTNNARAEMKTPEMFLNYYNAIFGNGFKERLEITFPNYLMANAGNFVGTISQFIYGGGGLVFDEYGKVIAIHNWVEATPTPRP